MLVSRASGAEGEPANRESLSPSVDANARDVRNRLEPHPSDKDAIESFYERDLANDTTTLVTPGASGAPNNMAAISAV